MLGTVMLKSRIIPIFNKTGLLNRIRNQLLIGLATPIETSRYCYLPLPYNLLVSQISHSNPFRGINFDDSFSLQKTSRFAHLR